MAKKSKTEFLERLKITGRNDPCPCGSGQKYKKCHLREDEEAEREYQAKLEKDRAKQAEAADEEATEAAGEEKSAEVQGKGGMERKQEGRDSGRPHARTGAKGGTFHVRQQGRSGR